MSPARPTPGRTADPTAGPTADEIVATVVDPELPMLSLVDLGVVREVRLAGPRVIVTITPTYSGCPAMAEMVGALRHRLAGAGFAEVEVRTRLSPAWTTDWITARGRDALSRAGIAPPGPAPARRAGPVPLTLGPPEAVTCPRCGSRRTARTAVFGSTACRSLHRCLHCAEPFEAVKGI